MIKTSGQSSVHLLTIYSVPSIMLYTQYHDVFILTDKEKPKFSDSSKATVVLSAHGASYLITDSVFLHCIATSSRENFLAVAEKDMGLFQIPCLFIRWISYLQADLEPRQGFRTAFFEIVPSVCRCTRKKCSINLVMLWGNPIHAQTFRVGEVGWGGSGGGGEFLLPPHSVAFPRQGLICLQHPGYSLGLPSSLQCLIMVCLANSCHCMFTLSWKLDRIKLHSKALTNYC